MKKILTLAITLTLSSALYAQVGVISADSLRLGNPAGTGGVALFGKTYLKNITAGSSFDSILVRNANGSIRMVPRSQLLAGLGGNNFIQNQNSASQTANMWIDGVIKSGGLNVDGTGVFTGKIGIGGSDDPAFQAKISTIGNGGLKVSTSAGSLYNLFTAGTSIGEFGIYNGGLYFQAYENLAKGIVFYPNRITPTAALTVHPSDKVGINNETPTEALDVSGKALVSVAPTDPTGVVRKIDLEDAITAIDLSSYQTLANLSTDLTASASKYPSVNAVNAGISAAIAAIDLSSKANTDGSNATGIWGIDISGNAATVTNGVYTSGHQTIAGNKDFSGQLSITGIASWTAGTRYITTVDAGTAVLRYNTDSDIKALLGISGGPFLPLTAGSSNTLTGDLFFNASKAIVFNTAATQMYESAGTLNFRTGSSDAYTIDASRNHDFKGGTVMFGNQIFIANNKFIYGRNAANSADILLFGLDNANKVRIDPSGVGTEFGSDVRINNTGSNMKLELNAAASSYAQLIYLKNNVFKWNAYVANSSDNYQIASSSGIAFDLSPAGNLTLSGGISAANISSTNNANNIVQRDGSGNFAAQNVTVNALLTTADPYASGWNGNLSAPTKDDLYDKIQSLAPSSSLATVATTGAYSDLSGLPALNLSNWNTAYGWGNHASAGYITASSTNTLTNKSGNISQWTNDSGYLTSSSLNASTSATASTIAQRDGNGYLHAVYYNAPANKSAPSSSGLHSIVGHTTTSGNDYYYDFNSTAVASFLGLGSAAYESTSAFRSSSYVPSWSEVTSKPSFATVATSGAYSDLSGLPSLSISNWNTSYGWGNHASAGYTTASSTNTLTNKSGNISQWTNDAGFITASSSNTLTNKSGNISQWTNNSGYLTAESDGLQSVTDRLASTTNNIYIGKGASNNVDAGSGIGFSSEYSSSPTYGLRWQMGAGGDMINLAYRSSTNSWDENLRITNSDGHLTARGNITAYSDSRLKTNIQTLPSVSDALRTIRAVEYDRIDSKEHHIGFIAQEVQKYFPALVHTGNDEKKTLSMAYQNFTAPLLKGWQEHDIVIREQAGQIKLQESRIGQLESELRELKELIKSRVK